MKNEIDKISKIKPVYIVWLMIIAYTIFFSYYTVMKHYIFQTHAYDLGIFLNSFYNTIYEGKFFYTTLWEGSRFQNHFSPILFLVLSIYTIIPKAETLLVLQSFILALGALPIYWIAKNEISKRAGIIFALLYLAYPAIHGINRFDFHEVALAPTFILFSFHYFREKKYNLFIIFTILSLISREDVAMVIAPMALLWLLESKERMNDWLRKKETIICIAIIFTSLIWFLIGTKLIIPSFSQEGYWFVKEYQPEFIFLDLDQKLLFIINIFLPLLFIPLFNKWILVTFPIFARILFSNRETRYQINNQHTSLMIPFIFISSIYFVKSVNEMVSVESIKKLFSGKLLYPIIILLLVMSFFISPIPKEINSKEMGSIKKIVVTPEGGPTPTGGMLKITPHYETLNDIIEMIPRNVSVYTQNNIFPHMSDRPKVYYVPGDIKIFKGWNNPQIGLFVQWEEADFEYILMDDTAGRWSAIRHLDLESLDILKNNYGLYANIDRIYLFKKGYNGSAQILPSLMENFDNKFIPGYYNGLLASYYNGSNFSEFIFTDRLAKINFNWNKKSPVPGLVNEDNFSIKFEGYLYIPVNGSYTFRLKSDDGSRLYLGNKLAVDFWNTTPVNAYYSSYLRKGLHKISIEYKENKRDAYVVLYWFTPWKGMYETVPEEYFYIPKRVINTRYGNSSYLGSNMSR